MEAKESMIGNEDSQKIRQEIKSMADSFKQVIFIADIGKFVSRIEAADIVGDKIGDIGAHFGVFEHGNSLGYKQYHGDSTQAQGQFCLN